MRTSITIGIKHGTGEAALVHGPSVKTSVQLDKLRALAKSSTSHPEFSRVEVWESDGGVQLVRKFDAPAKASAKDRFDVGKK